MEDQATNRMRVRLTDAEDTAVTQAAAARGMRPSDLAREALLTYIGQPVHQQNRGVEAVAGLGLGLLGLDETLVMRLEGVAQKLEQTALSTRIALDMAYASESVSSEIRGSLTDIAMSIGVLAGSIEPIEKDGLPSTARDAIGADTWHKNFGGS